MRNVYKINELSFVSLPEASFYQPGNDFTCLTSGEKISWEFVNDDYCDCKDGSDEPGKILEGRFSSDLVT
jgi:hypothetical protein